MRLLKHDARRGLARKLQRVDAGGEAIAGKLHFVGGGREAAHQVEELGIAQVAPVLGRSQLHEVAGLG
ncbi:hypothetical protein GCM10027422_11700 [Hymenobacter arcticus]